MGRDPDALSVISTGGFQFTRPAWGATSSRPSPSPAPCFNSRAPHGARPDELRLPADGGVSIHAPRMGRDGAQSAPQSAAWVSIHAPRMGRDSNFQALALLREVSIHAPRMGRDAASASAAATRYCFNSRAPHGARPDRLKRKRNRKRFNSRAPHGARPPNAPPSSTSSKFQFTRPAWGATNPAEACERSQAVSIHAPRMGRDT